MKSLTKILNNFKIQPDLWFFYGFLATFTLTIRKVIIDYPITGKFNEWTGIYLYLSDIFLVLTLASWLIYILHNKSVSLSIYILKLWLKKATFNLPLFLFLWSFVSILWADNQNIALFRSLKLLEFFLLYLYITYRIVPRETFLRNTFYIIILLGFFQAIIGILQFIKQSSLGLFWLFESHISSTTEGVAKIIIDNEKHIRAYGLFPHPNIFGGFLLVSMGLTLVYRKMFHVEHYKKIFNIASIIQFLCLILTFSKSAIIGLIIILVYAWQKNKKTLQSGNNVSRETYYGIDTKHLWRNITIAIVIILVFYSAGLNLGENLEKAFSERLSQFGIWKNTVSQTNLLVGSGMGSYIFHLPHRQAGVEQILPSLEAWQYQPIHNVFAIILAELGFIGLFVFVFFIFKLITNNKIVPRGTIFKGMLLGFIFIMLCDHYLWDIQQGQIVFWMISGLLASFKIAL